MTTLKVRLEKLGGTVREALKLKDLLKQEFGDLEVCTITLPRRPGVSCQFELDADDLIDDAWDISELWQVWVKHHGMKLTIECAP